MEGLPEGAVGSSYQTFLVVGRQQSVHDGLSALGLRGWIAPAGPDRTAVMPREDDDGYADASRLALAVCARFGFPTLSNELIDSDAIVMRAYRDGRQVHEYVSDQAMLVDWFIDEHDVSRFRLGGVEYPADAPSPRGPRGAEPAGLIDFGVGDVDADRLGRALRGEFAAAEARHEAILRALNLQPQGLMTACRWVQPGQLSDALPIETTRTAPSSAAGQEPDRDTIELVVQTGLPLEADPERAAAVLAHAVAGGAWLVRATVGYTAVIPGRAGGLEVLLMGRQLVPAPRSATYFVELQIGPGDGRPATDELIAVARQRWNAALRDRYGLNDPHAPAVLPVAKDQFQIGLAAARRLWSAGPKA